jgi:AbrB family looped-hinge helix DNA binding protein
MTYLATITSKRQFTIPSQLFKDIGFSEGDKVIVEESNGELIVKPVMDLIDKLSGSVSTPKFLKDKDLDLDEIIKTSKVEYFKKKK